MSDRYAKRSQRRARRRGLTLVEVLGGLALIGALLVTLLLFRIRHVRQLRSAEQQMAAVREADGLLTAWWTGEPGRVPVDASGTTGGFEWRTTVLPSRPLDSANAVVVRLQLFAFGAGGQPLVNVDVLQQDEHGQPGGQ